MHGGGDGSFGLGRVATLGAVVGMPPGPGSADKHQCVAGRQNHRGLIVRPEHLHAVNGLRFSLALLGDEAFDGLGVVHPAGQHHHKALVAADVAGDAHRRRMHSHIAQAVDGLQDRARAHLEHLVGVLPAAHGGHGLHGGAKVEVSALGNGHLPHDAAVGRKHPGVLRAGLRRRRRPGVGLALNGSDGGPGVVGLEENLAGQQTLEGRQGFGLLQLAQRANGHQPPRGARGGLLEDLANEALHGCGLVRVALGGLGGLVQQGHGAFAECAESALGGGAFGVVVAGEVLDQSGSVGGSDRRELRLHRGHRGGHPLDSPVGRRLYVVQQIASVALRHQRQQQHHQT